MSSSFFLRTWLIVLLAHVGTVGAQTVETYRKQLQDPNPEKRQEAILVLRTYPADSNVVSDLIDALGDKSAKVRWAAARVLGELAADPPRAVPALMDKLADEDALVRAVAAETLGNFGVAARPALSGLGALIGDPDLRVRRGAVLGLKGFAADSLEAQRLIETRVQDTEPYVRNTAVSALAYLGPASNKYLPLFISALSDRSDQVRSAAARGISQLGPAGASALPALVAASRIAESDSAYFLKYAIRELAKQHSEEAIRLLIQCLNDAENSLAGRVFAAEALGEIGPTAASATPDLLKASTDAPERLRRAAADALLLFTRASLESSPEGLSRAIQMLADENRFTRDRGRDALVHAGAAAVPLLLEALRHDTRDRVRIAAIDALSGAYEASSVVPVLREIAAGSGSDELRGAAVSGMGKMAAGLPASESARLVETLTGLLGNPRFRIRAIDSLSDVKTQPAAAVAAVTEALVRVLGETPRDEAAARECLRALRELGPPAQLAAAKVTPLLHDPILRGAAVQALGGMPVAESVSALLDLLHDPSDGIREVASQAIARILSWPEGRGFSDSIVPAMLKEMKDPSVRVRSASLAALGEAGDRAAVPAVLEALKDSSNEIRWEAAATLGGFLRDPSEKSIKKAAVPALILALDDPDSRVTLYAAMSLAACGAGCVEALPALRRTLAHTDATAARAINDAIKTLEAKVP